MEADTADKLERAELNGSEIAIIGLAGRFPGAQAIEQFWHNLRQGIESITHLTDEELRAAGVTPAEFNDPNYVRVARALEGEDLFDAFFFGYTPDEAAIMDPQHRLFLECAWEAMEHAAYAPGALDVPVGVFGGSSINTYMLNFFSNRYPIKPLDIVQIVIGNALGGLTTNVSFKLNLTGPSYAFHTHCSTSLVAVHLACQSLLLGECDMAIAGGVAIDIPQKKGYLYQDVGIFSPDGRCRAFDAKARGLVFGNGVGVVVLKRLEDALADGDCIHAIVKGTATSNDGAAKASYTAPGVGGQARAITEALAVAEIDPATVTYIETHGTGTPLGDAIEIRALAKAFNDYVKGQGAIAIGSVKTNIGHLGAAAGVAGLIKTVLALENKSLPPSLNFETPHPEIDFAHSPFYVNTELNEWPANHLPRRAGVSSFGFGSTNAHAIVEEAPPVAPSDPAMPWQLIVLSAKTHSALENSTANLARHLRRHPHLNLADVAYTLQIGRTAFDHRRALVCRDLEDAASCLEKKDNSRLLTNIPKARGRSFVFAFPGLGDQYTGMAQELYQLEPVFREQVDVCADSLTPLLGVDLRDILYPDEPPPHQTDQALAPAGSVRQFDLRKMLNREQRAPDEGAVALRQVSIAQPVMFVIEYALARLWQQWGIQPQAMIGYSLGEYVAACLAGVFSLQDALLLVARRGQMMQQLPDGAMLAVTLSEKQVQPFLSGNLSVAVISGPGVCIVAGPEDEVAALEEKLADRGMVCRHLRTTRAVHSKMMEPIAQDLEQLAKTVTLSPPKIPYISNLTGTWITTAQATDPGYWARHSCRTVRFSDGLGELLRTPGRIFIEAGPGETIGTLVRQHPGNAQATSTLACPSLGYSYDQTSDRAFLLNTLGQLWLEGVTVDWPGMYAHQRRHRLALPTYPFERQRYWIEPEQKTETQATALSRQADIADWFYIPSWKRTMPPGKGPDQKRRWMIFSNGDSFEQELIRRLKSRQDQVITILAGEQFTCEEDTFTIRPGCRADYDALRDVLHQRGFLATDAIHLWNMAPVDETSPPSSQQVLDRSFYSLLFVGQIIAEHNIRAKMKLGVVSSNMQKVTSMEVVHPEKATLLGPCKVISQEMPNFTCCSIDMVLPEPGSRQEAQCLEQLIAEHESSARDRVIAYRGYDRWVQTYEASPLPDVEETADRKLRQEGVYLITGGLGGIGLTLANYLARTVQARLILTTRSSFPEPDTWEEWLATHESHDRTSQRIRKVQDLEESGAEVVVVQADVADIQQMKTAVDMACSQFGTIHGVIHAAGLPGGGMIQLKTAQEAASVLKPKVQGTRVLEAVLQDTPLDFMVLCSSLMAPLGLFGQADYCAANTFLNAFAHAKGNSDCTIVSINWDAWREVGFWQEGTLNASDSDGATVADELFQSELEEAILPHEGIQVFQRVLCHNHLPQIVVCTRNLPTLLRQKMEEFALPHLLGTETRIEKSGAKRPRPNLQNDYIAPRNDTEEKLSIIWQELLGIDQVGVDDNFFELGGHSLLLTQLRNKVAEAFQAELSMRSLFENPSVAEMTQLVIASWQVVKEEKPISEQLQTAFPTKRQGLLEQYLIREVAHSLSIPPDQFQKDDSLTTLDLDLVAQVDLMRKFKQDLGIHYYPIEIVTHPSISELAHHILAERDRMSDLPNLATRNLLSAYTLKPFREGMAPGALLSPPARKNESIVFLHSSPRAGSTLLRVMLAGHPDIFCPPEINLLPYRDMQEWQQHIGYRSGFRWPAQGLHAAFTQLLNLEFKEGWEVVDDLVAQNKSVQDVYAQIQDLAGQRMFVDKTPAYWRDKETLRRSKVLFNAPKHIFLVRHPYAVIESVLRMRFDRQPQNRLFKEDDVDPYVAAETTWLLSTRNLLEFFKEIEPERQYVIRFEDLVSEPTNAMTDLCQFLGIPFDEALLNPYDSRHDRMIQGLGDPNILQHTQIDPSLGKIWQTIKLPRTLDKSTQQLAAKLGYELPENVERPITSHLLPLAQTQTGEAHLLASLDELTDEEVTAQLSRLLAQEKE